MVDKWIPITVDDSLNVAKEDNRYASQFVALSDGSMFFDGEYNEDKLLVTKTVTYNTQSNTWNILPSYNNVENGGYRQT